VKRGEERRGEDRRGEGRIGEKRRDLQKKKSKSKKVNEPENFSRENLLLHAQNPACFSISRRPRRSGRPELFVVYYLVNYSTRHVRSQEVPYRTVVT
jgi:hypothetical protein